MESKELIIAVVTILGSGAAFKFYESFIKTRRESARELRKEQRETTRNNVPWRPIEACEWNERGAWFCPIKILSLTQKVAELETKNKYLQ